jgi:hypothetical protein
MNDQPPLASLIGALGFPPPQHPLVSALLGIDPTAAQHPFMDVLRGGNSGPAAALRAFDPTASAKALDLFRRRTAPTWESF